MIVISTAFKMAQIAILHNENKNLKILDASCKHSENVLKTIDIMLDEMGISLADIGCYAVVVGPGSFTGLRIGVSIVKGLCAGRDKKVIALSSFDLIAYSYIKYNTPKEDFIVVINALSGLVFVRKYDSRGNALTDGKLISKEELDLYKENKVCLDEDNLPYTSISVNAEDLLECALKVKNKGDFIDYHIISPIYLRKSQAEAQLELKNLKNS